MKKAIFLFILVFFLLAGCAVMKEWGAVDKHEEYIEISVSFNPEHYPWILGKKFPQIAAWVESETNDPYTIFVTEGAGKNKWYFATERPSALPVWSGIHQKETDPPVDAITGATPSGEVFTLLWQIPEQLHGQQISIFLEANISFDYNDFYNQESKENDSGYSDVNGQPSIIWKSSLKVDNHPAEITPDVIGHGHVMGKDHNINADISKTTTAKDLFNYVRIKYFPAN